MRGLGIGELVLIAALIALFFGGRRISGLFTWLGKRTKETADQAKWIYQSIGGTEEEEVKAEGPVGQRLAAQMIAQFPEDEDEASRARVERVGRLLAAVAGEEREFTFRVVQAGFANAFALPGGHVFITRPLLDLCGNDDGELAYLLGHEMAHVIRRHAAERYVTQAVLSALPARGPAVSLITKGYSREHELEADADGAALAAKAGFDRDGAIRALRRLEEAGSKNRLFEEYWSTHPPVAERVAQLGGGSKG